MISPTNTNSVLPASHYARQLSFSKPQQLPHKRGNNRLWFLLIFSFLAISFGSSVAMADRCIGRSSVAAINGDFKIDAKVDQKNNSWNYVLTNTKTGKVRTGPLPLITKHAHLDFFINAKGNRFAVMNSTGGTHLENRFMVYDSTGKLISSLGIKDILTPFEQYKICRTVSHMHWLKGGKKPKVGLKMIEAKVKVKPAKPITNPYGVVKGNLVALETLQGRKVVISLDDGKVVPSLDDGNEFPVETKKK